MQERIAGLIRRSFQGVIMPRKKSLEIIFSEFVLTPSPSPSFVLLSCLPFSSSRHASSLSFISSLSRAVENTNYSQLLNVTLTRGHRGRDQLSFQVAIEDGKEGCPSPSSPCSVEYTSSSRTRSPPCLFLSVWCRTHPVSLGTERS